MKPLPDPDLVLRPWPRHSLRPVLPPSLRAFALIILVLLLASLGAAALLMMAAAGALGAA